MLTHMSSGILNEGCTVSIPSLVGRREQYHQKMGYKPGSNLATISGYLNTVNLDNFIYPGSSDCMKVGPNKSFPFFLS
jgi:hypothetical protein